MADRDVREQGDTHADAPTAAPLAPAASEGVRALTSIQGPNEDVLARVSETLRRFYLDQAELDAMMRELQATRGNAFVQRVITDVKAKEAAAPTATGQHAVSHAHKVDPERAGPDENGVSMQLIDPSNPMIGGAANYHQGNTYGFVQGQMSPDGNQSRAQLRGGYELDQSTFMYGGLEFGKTNETGSRQALDLGIERSSPGLATSLEGRLEHDNQGTRASVTSDSFVRLAGSSLYGRVLTSVQFDDDVHVQFGAGLSLTRREGMALTAVGLMSNDGAIDLRLQLDIMRGKIDGANDLADWKKHALISLIAGYRTQVEPNLLGSELGTPQVGFGDTGFYGGVRFSF
jgi:hypothetical protein